jgi:excinuclease ABC subunit A
MNIYYKAMLRSVAGHFNVAWKRLKKLPDDFKNILLNGSGEEHVDFKFWRAGKTSSIDRPFEGVLPNLERLATDSESEFIRNRLKQYMSPQFCDVCGGRLKPEILAVTLGGRGIYLAVQKQKI